MKTLRNFSLFFVLMLLSTTFGHSQGACKSVAIGTNYSTQQYYKITDGSLHEIKVDDWDIRMNYLDYTIETNEATITGCWVKTDQDNADPLVGTDNHQYDPATLDTTGMHLELNSWKKVHNNIDSYSEGALNRVQQTPAKGGLVEYGHSFYAGFSNYTPIHGIRGYRVFVMLLSDGTYKQFWTRIAHSDIGQQFSYADLDGVNRVDIQADLQQYLEQEFMYVDMKSSGLKAPSFAPDTSDYDLVFTQYFNETLQEFTAGVLVNKNLGVEEAHGVPYYDVVFTDNYTYGERAIIGDDWKLNLGIDFEIVADRNYLLKTSEGAEYLMYFCDFGGKVNGLYEFRLIPRSQIENGIKPVASFDLNQNQVCVGESLSVTNTSTDGNAYKWYFEGADIEIYHEETPSPVYSQKGEFDVVLYAYNLNEGGDTLNSDTLVLENAVLVEKAPTSSFNYTLNDYTATFTSLATDATNYSWDFGDSQTDNVANTTHTYATSGTYIVDFTVDNFCGSSSFSEEITIVDPVSQDPPIANFDIQKTQLCIGEELRLTNTSERATGFEWIMQGADVETSNVEHPVLRYSQPGFYSIVLKVSNEFGNDEISKQNIIEVLENPEAGFNLSKDYLEVRFNNTSQNGIAYSWDFGDGNFSQQESPLHTYNESGSYLVRLEVSGTCGIDVNEIELTVNEQVDPPVAKFSVENREVCVGGFVKLMDESSNAGTYAWEFPGGIPSTSNLPNPSVNYQQEGIYEIKLKVSNASGSYTYVMHNAVNVLEVPNAEFSFVNDDKTFYFKNESIGVTNVWWDFGDGASSTMNDPKHEYETSGLYDLTMIVENACSADTLNESIHVGETLGGGDLNAISKGFEISPNPSSDFISILGDLSKVKSIEIVDLTGKKIFHKNESLDQLISISLIPNGVYLIHLNFDSGVTHSRRFMKQ